MTYGQDTYSHDKRPAKSDPTCEKDLAYSYHEQAGKTYPESLQEFCDDIFGEGFVTVINRGFSGDWAEISRKRWKRNPHADVHFVMLGTNDSTTNSYVAKEAQQNIEKYINDMSKLIEQILDFGSAVVLLTPPKQSNETDLMRTAYRRILQLIGKQYHVPLIDTTQFFKPYPHQEVQSDVVHYNTKGYRVLAAKIAGILASMSSLYVPFYVRDKSAIIPSFDEYGITLRNQVTLEEQKDALFGVGSSALKGLAFHLNAKSKLTFSFIVQEDDIVIYPLFKMINDESALVFELDFGIVPGESVPGRLKYHGVREQTQIRNANSFYLPRKGYYTLLIENPSTTAGVYIYGFLAEKKNMQLNFFNKNKRR
ncbi:SGNH/GDSL hydrolase family protein (plasmid) [Arthrobacter citreus]|nr:SGNH/GDSL hydrolase family protein [Arthrobacter citreus]